MEFIFLCNINIYLADMCKIVVLDEAVVSDSVYDLLARVVGICYSLGGGVRYRRR